MLHFTRHDPNWLYNTLELKLILKKYYQFTTQYLQIDMINIIVNDTNYVIKKITFLICLTVNTSIYNIKEVKFITSLALLIYPFL